MSGRRSPQDGFSQDSAGLGAFLKRWTIPTIGAVTPVGLIVVNIAAFIDHHLAEFRLAITIMAFISSMLLNSWVGLNIYRVVKRRFPSLGLVQERNQEWVLMAGMVIVIASAVVTALFCYLGLANERELPNNLTFITGVGAILLPILLQGLFGRALDTGGKKGRQASGGSSGLPSAGAGAVASGEQRRTLAQPPRPGVPPPPPPPPPTRG